MKRVKMPFKVTGNHTSRYTTTYDSKRGGWYKETSPEGGDSKNPAPAPRGPKSGPKQTR